MVGSEVIRLNLGCGPKRIDGWINVDYAIAARLAKYPIVGPVLSRLFRNNWHPEIVIADLRKSFVWEDNSVDVVYSSHTLEHFSKLEGTEFLSECHRVVKPGGIIRIVVPDLQVLVKDYISGRLAADDFVDELDVLFVSDGSALRRLLAPYLQFPHRCMYNTVSLLRVMDEIGFNTEPKSPFEGAIVDVEKIELEHRTIDAVIAEGVKRY